MGTPEKISLSVIPKISKKLAFRTLFLVVVFGSLAGGLYWFLKVRSDINGLHTDDTVGWISAVQYAPQSQAVLISPDGKIHKDDGHLAGTEDRDVVWSPKGNFLYYVSDRVDHNFNLFRWAPDQTTPDQRTIGTRARGNLRFPAQPTDESDNVAKGLIITGGIVQEFNPADATTRQILPPTSKEISQSKGGDESGTEGQFEGYYGTLGTSFREAQWCNGHHDIAAIMRRDSGEILVLQDMRLDADGKFLQPSPIIAGEHVDFAVNPKDGDLVFCVTGFQFPDAASALDENGKKRKRPFVNGIATYSFAGKSGILTANQGEVTFGSPAISPDGTALAVVLGKRQNGDITPVGLATLSSKNDPSYKGRQFGGDVHEPSWSPDGTHILVAVKRPGKSRTIFELPTDGSPPRNITGDLGDFGFPKYSPQVKAN